MIRFYEKGIDVIKKSFAGAAKGIICTPYYTERGLKLLDPFFRCRRGGRVLDTV